MRSGKSRRVGLFSFFVFASITHSALAGMPVYELDEVSRLRLEDISFFLLLLLLASLGIRLLWNFLARDIPKLPRLSFFKALSLTGLLSLLMLLILVMISGARELLTPGAWYRQGSHYRPNDTGNMEARQQGIESLRSAVMLYAHAHNGSFPLHDYVSEIPPRLWETPDSTGTRYVYIGGISLAETNSVLAFEPQKFGSERFVLFADGRIERLSTEQIHRLIGVRDSQ